MYLQNGGVMAPSRVHFNHRAGEMRQVPKEFLQNLEKNYRDVSQLVQDLALYGIHLREKDVYAMAESAKQNNSIAMDNAQLYPITQPSIPVPLQFLQNWLPGFVFVVTDARKIDDLIGMMNIGSWSDVQVVQGVMEPLGSALVYGDYTTVPFSSWNTNYVWRSVVRFEQGMQVGVLESEQAARGNINNDASKRSAAALSLEIARNYVGFLGYNAGVNNTYGFLNEPGLPAYVTAATGASSSTTWASKTFLEIVNDINAMVARLYTQSGNLVDLEKVNATLAVATAVYTYLGTVSEFNMSVRDWLTKTYPKIRVVSAPELDGANGGANVGYLYADRINDDSTDDGAVFAQLVPAKFQTVGVSQNAKNYIEDFTNATAGVMCKRPWAVTRITGI